MNQSVPHRTPFKGCTLQGGNRRQTRLSQLKANASSMQNITSVSDIPNKYKGVLLDQFGVLHNGKTAYPDAVEAVKKLVEAGKKIVVLSNSSRRAHLTIPKLEKLGYDASWFSGAVTSGDITHQYLEARPDDWWRQLGRKCLHLTWGERGRVPLAGLNLQVDDLKVIITGVST